MRRLPQLPPRITNLRGWHKFKVGEGDAAEEVAERVDLAKGVADAAALQGKVAEAVLGDIEGADTQEAAHVAQAVAAATEEVADALANLGIAEVATPEEAAHSEKEEAVLKGAVLHVVMVTDLSELVITTIRELSACLMLDISTKMIAALAEPHSYTRYSKQMLPPKNILVTLFKG